MSTPSRAARRVPRLVAEQREIATLAPQQDLGRPQDPLVGALRQHDVPPVVARAVDQRVLEHQRRHRGRRRDLEPLEQRLAVDVVLEQRERRRDLARRVDADRARPTRPPRWSRTCRARWRRCRRSGHPRSAPARVRRPQAAGEHDAGGRGQRARSVGEQRREYDVGAISGRDQHARRRSAARAGWAASSPPPARRAPRARAPRGCRRRGRRRRRRGPRPSSAPSAACPRARRTRARRR